MKYDSAPTSILRHQDCSRGTVRGFLCQPIRKHRRRGTCYWRRCRGRGRRSREIGCCRRGHDGGISAFERSTKRQIVNIRPCLEGRGVALRVSRIAPVRFDNDLETFASLARRNVTESVGVVGNVTYLWQLLWAKSDANLLPECTPVIRGTQRHDEPVFIENPANSRVAVGLHNFSARTTWGRGLRHLVESLIDSRPGDVDRVKVTGIGEGVACHNVRGKCGEWGWGFCRPDRSLLNSRGHSD